ncbi:MAG: amidohydrolase family protein [Actinomycetaceae bacterium]|nr:amidohydrolase family protein [Actinomycetaceae bacterium]
MILRGHVLWSASATPSGKDGRAQPRWDSGTFEIRDGRIYRSTSPASADYEGWVLPGLVDVHCHIGIGPQGAVGDEQMLAQARTDRASGVLLARDCGVPVDNSAVTNRPDTLKVIQSGRHIARPKRYIRGLSIEVENEADLPRIMAEQSMAGDGWVKIVADWIDRSEGADSDLKPLWSTAALVDGIAAAHEAGARVTAHVFGREAIDGLLEGGIDCIEHGAGMEESHVQEAAERGIPVTPTLMQVDLFNEFADQAGSKYPVYGSTMRMLARRHDELLGMLCDYQIQLLPGTDAGGYQQHGQLPTELSKWTRMGLSPSDIIDAATWRAREYLGFPSLAEGAPADLVIYDRDPREDISVLSDPITTVLDGQIQS